jgi:hypothetical protein
MIKNLLIACLACACVGLLIRNYSIRWFLDTENTIDHRAPTVSVPRTGAIGSAGVAALRDGAGPPGASAPGITLTPAQLEHVRYLLMRNIAWRYSRYLARAGLTSEKANLLLDLLVDEQSAALDAEVQTGSLGSGSAGSRARADEALQADRKMIEDLLGPDGASELEKAGIEQIQNTTSSEALQALQGKAALADSDRDQLTKALQGFSPTTGIGDLIGAQTEITPDVEQRLRADNAVQVDAVLTQVANIVGADQAQAFRNWDEAELNKGLDLAKKVWAANHRSG